MSLGRYVFPDRPCELSLVLLFTPSSTLTSFHLVDLPLSTLYEYARTSLGGAWRALVSRYRPR
jgi:hypothetical protein